jgi:glycosyltransferase involved in cell wall biosynthesis
LTLAKLDTFISVIAAFHDDAALVEPFIRETAGLLSERYTHYEILLIDDGSRDNTVAKITGLLTQLPNLRLIRLSRRFGTDIALTSGLESAIGDYVVTLIPKTDPPVLIPSLIEDCRQGKEMLFGVRVAETSGSGPLRWATSAFYLLAEKVFRLSILRHATYFQVYSRQALNSVVRVKDKTRYLRLISAILGFSNRTFTYQPIQRAGDEPDRSWADSFTLALGLLTAHSANPLRVVSLTGLLASVLNLLYAFYILSVYLLKPHVAEGWTTLSLQTAGLFFWVLLILTVLSEYIGRILGELKDRPLYFTLEEKNSSVLTPDAERRNIVNASPE